MAKEWEQRLEELGKTQARAQRDARRRERAPSVPDRKPRADADRKPAGDRPWSRSEARRRSDPDARRRPGSDTRRPKPEPDRRRRPEPESDAGIRAERAGGRRRDQARPPGLLSSGHATTMRDHSLRPLIILAAIQTAVLLVALVLIARFAGFF